MSVTQVMHVGEKWIVLEKSLRSSINGNDEYALQRVRDGEVKIACVGKCKPVKIVT